MKQTIVGKMFKSSGYFPLLFLFPALAFFLLSSLIACEPSAKAPVPSAAENNEKLARTLFEYFNRHEWDKLAALYAENAEFLDPALGLKPVTQTRQQTQAKYAELAQIFPDIHDEVLRVFPSGDKNVIVEFVSTGTAPNQTKFELPICVVFTLENGLITKDYTYYDNTEAPAEEQ